jgi:hypothetical protein
MDTAPGIQDNNPQATVAANQAVFNANPKLFGDSQVTYQTGSQDNPTGSTPYGANGLTVTTGTSTGTRAGISGLGQDISSALTDGTFASLFPTPDTSALTTQNNNDQAAGQAQQTALDQQRDQTITDINNSFDTQKTTLGTTQANQTGQQSNTLARIGGYLGDSAAGQGAMIKLDQTHQQQMSALESKRQAAINQARVAYTSKQFALAHQLATESATYQKEMLTQQKNYQDTKFKYLNEVKNQQATQLKQQTADLNTQNKARDFAAKHNIQQPFYDIGGTVFDSKTGQAFTTADEFMKAGGKADYSNVQGVETKGDTYAINSKQQGPDGQLHQVRTTYDAQGNITNRTVEGVTQKANTPKGTPPQDKVFSAVDNKFTQAEAALKQDPNWDGKMDPTFYQNMKQAYISQVATTPKDVKAAAAAFDAKYSGTLSNSERANLGIKGTPAKTSTHTDAKGKTSTTTTKPK